MNVARGRMVVDQSAVDLERRVEEMALTYTGVVFARAYVDPRRREVSVKACVERGDTMPQAVIGADMAPRVAAQGWKLTHVEIIDGTHRNSDEGSQ